MVRKKSYQSSLEPSFSKVCRTDQLYLCSRQRRCSAAVLVLGNSSQLAIETGTVCCEACLFYHLLPTSRKQLQASTVLASSILRHLMHRSNAQLFLELACVWLGPTIDAVHTKVNLSLGFEDVHLPDRSVCATSDAPQFRQLNLFGKKPNQTR